MDMKASDFAIALTNAPYEKRVGMIRDCPDEILNECILGLPDHHRNMPAFRAEWQMRLAKRQTSDQLVTSKRDEEKHLELRRDNKVIISLTSAALFFAALPFIWDFVRWILSKMQKAPPQ